MTDIHTHILPGVDDGSDSFETSLELLKEEIKEGVTEVVLTPHQNELNLIKSELTDRFIAFRENVLDLPIKLYLGSEVYYYEDLKNDLKKDKILTLNGSKYVLVEFSTSTETNIKDALYDIFVAGFKPVIAHIERYSYLKESDYDEIYKYALIQVNAASFGRKEYKRILKYLFKKKYLDFVASDCHDLKRRNVDFKKAKKFIQKDKELYKKIFENKAPWM